jgi:hypothetical protein
MARIQGASKSEAGPMVRLVYRLGPRMMKKLTGRAPQTGSGLEPMKIWAYQPKMMMGMGRFNQAVRKGKSVDERLKNLVELKGAQMIGCEFRVDLGSQICRNSGLSDRHHMRGCSWSGFDLGHQALQFLLGLALGQAIARACDALEPDDSLDLPVVLPPLPVVADASGPVGFFEQCACSVASARPRLFRGHQTSPSRDGTAFARARDQPSGIRLTSPRD